MPLSLNDTPVAYICEHDDQKTVFSRTFIFYDTSKKTFCLRGLIGYELDAAHPQFAYNCETVGPVLDYLDFINAKNALYTYELFNVSKLPQHSENITFEMLQANKSHWLSAYDGHKYDKKRVSQLLRIVRGMAWTP